ncbi:unnamed protein product [Scytosiphon promiscuus]
MRRGNVEQAEFPKLSAVLFGEGVLNDAMSILLFQTVSFYFPCYLSDSDTC